MAATITGAVTVILTGATRVSVSRSLPWLCGSGGPDANVP